MIFEGRNILPAVESGSINQQSDFPVLTDEIIGLRRNWRKSSAFNFSGAVILNALA